MFWIRFEAFIHLGNVVVVLFFSSGVQSSLKVSLVLNVQPFTYVFNPNTVLQMIVILNELRVF